jgi:hypothetical protein
MVLQEQIMFIGELKLIKKINDTLKEQHTRIIGFIKKQRLISLGNVGRMTENNIVQKISRWKPMSKRPTRRPKTRWEGEVFEDERSMNVRNLKNVAQNRDSW